MPLVFVRFPFSTFHQDRFPCQTLFSLLPFRPCIQGRRHKKRIGALQVYASSRRCIGLRFRVPPPSPSSLSRWRAARVYAASALKPAKAKVRGSAPRPPPRLFRHNGVSLRRIPVCPKNQVCDAGRFVSASRDTWRPRDKDSPRGARLPDAPAVTVQISARLSAPGQVCRALETDVDKGCNSSLTIARQTRAGQAARPL